MRQHQTEETPKPEEVASPAMEEVNQPERKIKIMGIFRRFTKVLSEKHKLCSVSNTCKACALQAAFKVPKIVDFQIQSVTLKVLSERHFKFKDKL